MNAGRGARRVLVIGPSNIGDAILMSGVIGHLRSLLPGAYLTLAVGERAQALFADDPRIQTLVDLSAFESGLGRLRLFIAFWRYHPQIVVDLRDTLFSFLLKPWLIGRYLARPPASIRHMRDRHLWKLRRQLPRQLRLILNKEETPAFWFSAKDKMQIDTLYRRLSLNAAKRLVVICPGARSHIKRWTAEGFARVADALITEDNAEIIFSGETEERPIIDETLGFMRHRAHTTVGLTTIRQLGVLMQRASLVLTNDSASLHLASTVGAPTVALFGPTDADKYGPTAPQSRMLRRQIFCSPCEQAVCVFNHECMRFIPAEEVYRAAKALLAMGK